MSAKSGSSLHETQMAFAAHIRDPENQPKPEEIEDRRMGIYRDLFFNNVEGFLANNFPVIKRIYGEQGWKALARDFFIRHRAHTPLFPELPREFLQFVQEHRGPQAGDPPFLLELAHYEWAELAVSLLDDSLLHPVEDNLLDQPLARSPLAWLLSYNFKVHKIRPDYQPTTADDQPTHLVVYRDIKDDVHFLEVNAVLARLLDLIENQPADGRTHIATIAGELGQPMNDTFLARGEQLLKDLAERRIIGVAS